MKSAVNMDDDTWTGSDCAFQMAAAWLRTCLVEHSGCRRGQIDLPDLPKRIIDVGPPDGSEAPRLYPGKGIRDIYFALSYRWSERTKDFMTTKAKHRAYYFEIPTHELSQTIRDAIAITRIFGVRYLWIDALCIVQDDGKDWRLQAKNMARIYQNATLTISAAGKMVEGWEGCFKFRKRRRVRPVDCRHRWPDGSSVYIFADRLATGDGIRPASVLDTRGWILQEQILSPRILTYSDHELFWDCATLNASESFPGQIPTFYDADLSQRHMRLFKDAISRGQTWGSAKFKKTKLLMHWKKVIENYSARNLTNERDKLVALLGIAEQTADLVQDELLFGLWKDTLWREVLWWVKDPQTAVASTTYGAVTWSWLSLHGAVSFDLSRDSEEYAIDPCIRILDVDIQESEDYYHASTDSGAAPMLGELRVRGKVVPFHLFPEKLDPAAATGSSPLLISKWRADVPRLNTAAIKCLVVAASAFYVYGLALFPYPSHDRQDVAYLRVGFVQWIVSNTQDPQKMLYKFGWNRRQRWWLEGSGLEIIRIK